MSNQRNSHQRQSQQQSGSDTNQQPDESGGGEGNVDAARRYNESAHNFVESGKADKAMEDLEKSAGNDDPALQQAEADVRERIKETDPAVSRDYRKPHQHKDND